MAKVTATRVRLPPAGSETLPPGRRQPCRPLGFYGGVGGGASAEARGLTGGAGRGLREGRGLRSRVLGLAGPQFAPDPLGWGSRSLATLGLGAGAVWVISLISNQFRAHPRITLYFKCSFRPVEVLYSVKHFEGAVRRCANTRTVFVWR